MRQYAFPSRLSRYSQSMSCTKRGSCVSGNTVPIISRTTSNKKSGYRKSRIESLIGLGIEPTVVPDHRVMDGINAVRRMFDRSFIDPDRCSRGLEALRNYVHEWSVDLRDWRASPKHDWASHAADSPRIFAMGHVEPDFRSKGRRRWAEPVASGSHWSA